MMVPTDGWPPALIDALDSEDERDASLRSLDALADRLAVTEPDPALGERLRERAERPPWRYAPFFARVGALLDLPEDAVKELLGRLADPGALTWGGLPGIRVLDFEGGPEVADADVALVRFEPGTRFPRHEHHGPESVLILEGGYVDEGGAEYGPGDRHDMAPGSVHGFEVTEDEPCIAITVLRGGLHFRSLPLRLLARLIGR